ncbi:MAG: ribosome recycling factor [Thermodesulfovibrionales bacterium]|nr:ribosome recycling factor [Thermodesulfovibrionales bacterium]
MQDIKKKATEKMSGAIESLKKDFASIRTGRASLALLDGITVDYYGTATPVNQVATLGIPDPRQITIQPWEQSIIPAIEKAILKSGLGLTPGNDGKIIRLNIPPLTEERRKELVKVARKRAEEARVAIRNIRRDINDELKKSEKEEHISEDEVKRFHEDIQKITDSYIHKADEVLQHKENEIMEV